MEKDPKMIKQKKLPITENGEAKIVSDEDRKEAEGNDQTVK